MPSAPDPSLAPREIQRRLRAGESLEDVAAAAGTTVDRIRAFALPVLAERDHVLALALSCEIDESGTTLGEVLERRLGEAGVGLERASRSARVGADHRWHIALELPGGQATFRFDAGSRLVTPEDELANWLAGRRGGPPPLTRPVAPDGAGETGEAAPAAAPSRHKRASIPSWDEILLGDQRDD